MVKFLFIIWQLPQWILGLLVRLFTGRRVDWHYWNDVTVYYKENMMNGIALGEVIILDPIHQQLSGNPGHLRRTLDHEYGHVLQSRMLGPLYLIVVGLPSIVQNILSYWGVIDPFRYYQRFPENWADKLGRVDRKTS